MTSTVAAIGLGSNLHNPARQIETAASTLSMHEHCTLIQLSSIYRSEPLGGMDQPDYLNAVMTISARISAMALLRELQKIETEMGRSRSSQRWAARVIDLDLLVFGQDRITEPDLTVPHPGIASRNFVLLPLQEICPDMHIPGLGRVDNVPVDHLETRIERLRASDDVGQ